MQIEPPAPTFGRRYARGEAQIVWTTLVSDLGRLPVVERFDAVVSVRDVGEVVDVTPAKKKE